MLVHVDEMITRIAPPSPTYPKVVKRKPGGKKNRKKVKKGRKTKRREDCTKEGNKVKSESA
jgi:hypothetical protein